MSSTASHDAGRVEVDDAVRALDRIEHIAVLMMSREAEQGRLDDRGVIEGFVSEAALADQR
jgi:hypothetical protein